MSDSDTSSDLKVKYMTQDNNNLLEDRNKKPQSTDTDYYFNMIANPTKVVNKPKTESESSELNNMLKNTNSNSSDSSSETSKRSSSESSKSNKSSRRSTHSESKPTYDKMKVNISPKPPVAPAYPLPPVIKSEEIEPVEEVKPLTQQEIRMKKIELLRKLSEIKAKGFQLTKDYDFNSSLEEMEYEYDLLRSFADKRNGVKLFKNGLLQAASVIEFLNDKYDPFDFHLSGWGEHLSVESDNWEDVLEELYEKYKGSGKKMAPEIKLVYLIVVSAAAFHMTKAHASKLPGLDSVLAANPGLISKIISPGKGESSQFMSAQELNIEKQKTEFKKRDMENKQAQQNKMQQMQQQAQIQKLQEQLLKQQEIINMQSEPVAANSKPLPPSISANQLRPTMADIKAPSQVKDILSRIHNIKPSLRSQENETQDETSSQNDRLVSETTYSESNPKKKGKVQKKSNISII